MGTPIVTALCGAALPLLLLLNILSDDDESISGWKLYERIDIIVLIFSVIAVVLAIGAVVNGARGFSVGAAALMFANFGLVLGLPIETTAQSDAGVAIGTWLSAIVALVGGGAAALAAASGPAAAKPSGPLPAGAGGGGPSPVFTTPLAGAQPAAPQGGAQAGWYPDPHGQARLRYFDGRDWTQQTSN